MGSRRLATLLSILTVENNKELLGNDCSRLGCLSWISDRNLLAYMVAGRRAEGVGCRDGRDCEQVVYPRRGVLVMC